MNWFKQQLANVAGTQEPDYGPTAIKAVTEQAQTTPYTELTVNDLKWKAMDTTNVETQTFYLMSDEGVTAMAQVIYSNVGGIHTTTQFNSKIHDHGGPGKHQWCSDPLKNHGFDEAHTAFHADNVSVELNEAGDTYKIKSAVNSDCLVNLTIKRTAPGFQVGTDGTSYFGTDLNNPWGSMRHGFWARCSVTGTMQTKTKTYDMTGRAAYSKALQGMKPHHAAAKWNFVDFQTPTYSAILMDFTTPSSYGRTVVGVGGIVKDGEIIYAGLCEAKHLAVSLDTETEWPEPKAVLFTWKGRSKDGKAIEAEIMGDLPKRTDRVDVLAHIPQFVKNVLSSATGLRPCIYQYITKDTLTLKIKVGEEEKSETGKLFSEATFIS